MAKGVGRLFEALADPTRRQLVQLLSERPRRAGEIAQCTGLSGPAMSRHLRILLRAGIVADERSPGDARVRMFRLRREGHGGSRLTGDRPARVRRLPRPR